MAGDFFNTQVDLGIKSVQLNSGESIIGHVWYDEARKEYDVENPVAPQMRQTQQGINVQLGALRPWLKDIKKQTLRDSSVAYISDVADEMEKVYRQMTSDIQLADASELSKILTVK
jgi:hypothetical protein